MNKDRKNKQRTWSRSISRLNAVQALFQMEASNQGADYVIADFLENGFGEMIDGVQLHSPNKNFFRTLLHSAVDNQQKIDRLIHSKLPDNWTIDRIDPTIRAIFRASCAEMILNKTPVKVIINEYVDITESFFPAGKESGFVNAIVENLVKELTPIARES
ncbi:MAG: transcription antitermination factor NusB [Rhodobacteraceae bacterium]|nr:transcription antitermination factor NusB [Paracoccaceae bacterium]MCY4251115.1 transcription antitermination factor NusB [Paracoccaceae bacterium]